METQQNKQSATEAAGYIAGLGVGMTCTAMRGKHMSAAVIVLAGAVLLLGGSFIRHSDTQLFVQATGCAVLAMGLYGWFVSVSAK